MFKKIMFVLIMAVIVTVLFVGCESVERWGKSIKSDFGGLERRVVWTGFDGSKRVWKGKFKIDSNEGSPTVYFISEGKTVILGPGYYSEEL